MDTYILCYIQHTSYIFSFRDRQFAREKFFYRLSHTVYAYKIFSEIKLNKLFNLSIKQILYEIYTLHSCLHRIRYRINDFCSSLVNQRNKSNSELQRELIDIKYQSNRQCKKKKKRKNGCIYFNSHIFPSLLFLNFIIILYFVLLFMCNDYKC